MADDDEPLLRAWREGDRKAGEALVDRHFAALRRFFRTKVPEPADLVQRTFLACLEHLDRFRGDSSFRSFLFAIAHNLLRKHYREQAGPRGKVDLGTVSAEELQPSPSQVLAASNEKRLLLRALRRLSVEQQVLLELHYWERLKLAELAVVLELPVGTVKTRMRAARKRLEALIAELSASPGLLESTLTHLDEWARGLRNTPEDDPPEDDPPSDG